MWLMDRWLGCGVIRFGMDKPMEVGWVGYMGCLGWNSVKKNGIMVCNFI